MGCCRARESHSVGGEFPAIIPEDIHLQSSLDSSLSQLSSLYVFTAFLCWFTCNLFRLIPGYHLQMDHNCHPNPCTFTNDDHLPTTYVTEQCNQVNKIQLVYNQFHLEIISLEHIINQNFICICKIFAVYACTLCSKCEPQYLSWYGD
jgi:hypothetical protein